MRGQYLCEICGIRAAHPELFGQVQDLSNEDIPVCPPCCEKMDIEYLLENPEDADIEQSREETEFADIEQSLKAADDGDLDEPD